ncbi:MAG: thioredoxin domain-containing protein [Bacteroidetes bacterium]|nr:MAG: thioredoxin domain-containing protein [Bacteroidota bacterium]
MNRLINEKSPYLLQHAHNPVDWYPWGEEAFLKAKAENKPIFLSIGYSTCYWCHVMEREVFENEAIAKLMNEKLISIKVDREERPDIDRIYMSAVQAMTGSGGWPMSVFLMHDLKPFFGGTYFPPDSRYGRPGFPQLVERIFELWQTERDKIINSATTIVSHLSDAHITHPVSHIGEINSPLTLRAVSRLPLTNCFTLLKQSFDPVNAGFGNAPKFPRPAVFNFLVRQYARTGDQQALSMTLKTLRAMALGGMYDHLGSGFHRYSVDEQWRVPHFEKMLYDQAQLVCSYLDAYQITHDEFYAAVATDVLNYVLRQMTHPDGGFYSAEDAESALSHDSLHEKEEGAFYLWTKAEIEKIVGSHVDVFCYSFGVEEQGNAPSDPLGVFHGKNILRERCSVIETAKQFNLPEFEVGTILRQAKEKLFTERNKRPRPFLDDKIITAWNGLMISAFARASQILHNKKYLQAAQNAAQFILKNSYHPESHVLLRRWRNGEARFNGSLQDYAFFIQGLLDLYEASFETIYIEHAITLTKHQIEIFWDEVNHAFYDSADEDSSLILRLKEEYDGAEPTGNSIASLNLLRLAHITSNNDWKTKAELTISYFTNILNQRPDVLPQMLVALDWLLSVPIEIVIAGKKHSGDTNQMFEEIHRHYIPNKVILLADSSENQKFLEQFLPFIKPMQPIKGKATLYLCEKFACQLPTSDISTVQQLLPQINSVKL